MNTFRLVAKYAAAADSNHTASIVLVGESEGRSGLEALAIELRLLLESVERAKDIFGDDFRFVSRSFDEL